MRLSSTSIIHLALLFVCLFFSISTTEGALDFATGQVNMRTLRRPITEDEVSTLSADYSPRIRPMTGD